MEGQHRRGCPGVRLPGQGAGLPRPGGRGHPGVPAAAGRLQGDYNLMTKQCSRLLVSTSVMAKIGHNAYVLSYYDGL